MLRTLARLCLAGIFIVSGADTVMNPDGRAQKVAAAGIPQPRQATILNGFVMVISGLALALGIFPRLAAAALIGTLIPTTAVGHAFWNETSPVDQASQRIHFLKNLSMLGGLLVVVTNREA